MVAIECLEDCPVVNTPLAQLTELFPDLKATVVGICRDGKLFVPHSADQMLVGDLAYVVCDKRPGPPHARPVRPRGAGGDPHRHRRRRQYRPLRRRARSRHEAAETKIKIIESDRERAVEIADQLRRTVVLHGSALDQKHPACEADIQDADLMVALTNNDQVNILASVMAKRLGCKREPGADQQSVLSRT